MSVKFVGADAPALTREQSAMVDAYREEADRRLRSFVSRIETSLPPGIVGSIAVSGASEQAATVYVGMQRNGCAKHQDVVEQTLLAAFRYAVGRYHEANRSSAS
mgnify:CR=1 FL=1